MRLGKACLLVGAVFGADCSPSPGPLLTVTATSLAGSGSETSAAYSRTVSGIHSGTMIVQYNGPNTNAWMFSTDGGKTPHFCNVGKLGCGPGGGIVPKAPTDGGLLLAGTYPQLAWGGDPAVAASPDGSTVAMANLAFVINDPATKPGANPNAVVVSTSIDGGQTFDNTQFANPTTCYGKFSDQESLAADPTIANRYWIVWRQQGPEINFFGSCGRGFDVRPDGSISWLAEEAAVPTPHTGNYSVGGLIVQAQGQGVGGDVVTVVNSDTNQAANNCGGLYGENWYSVTSYDGGKTWPTTTLIATSNLQWACLPSDVNGQIQTGIRDFAFVRDPKSGRMWVALPADYNEGFQLYRSDDFGQSWQPDALVGVGQAQTFFPTLGIDDQEHMGMSFQELSGGSVSTWFAGTPKGLGFIAIPITALYSPTDNSGYTRSLGDYAGMATIPTGDLAAVGVTNNPTFLPAWTQTAGGASQVTAALVEVSP